MSRCASIRLVPSAAEAELVLLELWSLSLVDVKRPCPFEAPPTPRACCSHPCRSWRAPSPSGGYRLGGFASPHLGRQSHHTLLQALHGKVQGRDVRPRKGQRRLRGTDAQAARRDWRESLQNPATSATIPCEEKPHNPNNAGSPEGSAARRATCGRQLLLRAQTTHNPVRGPRKEMIASTMLGGPWNALAK